MDGYGICFEFSARNDEDAERLRKMIEDYLINTSIGGADGVTAMMRPSWYRFDREFNVRLKDV